MNMSTLEKVEKIDRRIVYLVLIVVVAAILLRPIGLPIPISSSTKKYYEAINSLPSGSVIALGVDFDAGALPELGPMLEATLKQLFASDKKFVIFSLWGGGPAVSTIYLNKLKDLIESSGKKYGEDYVLLPYIAGGETAAAALAKDFKNTVKNDYYGTPVDQIPLLKNLNTANDFALLITITAGTPGVEEYLRQWVSPFGIKFNVGALGVSAPNYMPYYTSGQIYGMIQGLRGAAEYELLVGSPSIAVSSMDALSAGHIVTIVFILLGNAVFLLRKYSRKEVKS